MQTRGSRWVGLYFPKLMGVWVALLVMGWVPAETVGVWGMGSTAHIPQGLLRPCPHPGLLGPELRICLQLPHKHEETLAALTTTRAARGMRMEDRAQGCSPPRKTRGWRHRRPPPGEGALPASSRLGVATVATYILKDVIFSNFLLFTFPTVERTLY